MLKSRPYKALKKHELIKDFMTTQVADKLRLNRLNTWTTYYALRKLIECKRAEEVAATLTRMHLLGFPAIDYLAEQQGIDAETMYVDIVRNLHTPSELFFNIVDYLEENTDKLCPYQQPVSKSL
jgi:hypothetical protein